MGSCSSAPAHPPTKEGVMLYLLTATEKLDGVRLRLRNAKMRMEQETPLPENFQNIEQAVLITTKVTLLQMHEHLNKLEELSRALH